MSMIWFVAFGSVSLAVVVLAVVVMGILRRVVQALARVEALVADLEAKGLDVSLPMVGQASPLQVPDTIPYEDFTITFLELGCDACRSLASDLSSRRFRRAATPNHVVVVDELVGEFAHLPPTVTVIHDVEGTLFDEWQVTATPTSYYVSAAGLVRAGHHPNKASDLEALRAKAIKEIGLAHTANAN